MNSSRRLKWAAKVELVHSTFLVGMICLMTLNVGILGSSLIEETLANADDTKTRLWGFALGMIQTWRVFKWQAGWMKSSCEVAVVNLFK